MLIKVTNILALSSLRQLLAHRQMHHVKLLIDKRFSRTMKQAWLAVGRTILGSTAARRRTWWEAGQWWRLRRQWRRRLSTYIHIWSALYTLWKHDNYWVINLSTGGVHLWGGEEEEEQHHEQHWNLFAGSNICVRGYIFCKIKYLCERSYFFLQIKSVKEDILSIVILPLVTCHDDVVKMMWINHHWLLIKRHNKWMCKD